MSREAIILAYAHGYLTPSQSGDSDIGAKGSKVRSPRMKRFIELESVDSSGRLVKKSLTIPMWALDPVKYKARKLTSINTTKVIANGMKAGKIISAAEGDRIEKQAFSRIYYSDHPFKKDIEALKSFLQAKLLYQVHGDIEKVQEAQAVLNTFAAGTIPDPDEYTIDAYMCCKRVVETLDAGATKRVGIYLSRC